MQPIRPAPDDSQAHAVAPCPAPRPVPARRAVLCGAWVLACALALALPDTPAVAQDAADGRWVATWGAAPSGPPASGAQVFRNQTLRLIAHTSIGGNRVRVRLSNAFGAQPLHIGAARIGVVSGGPEVAPGSSRVLAFGARTAVTISAGATVLSDPVELNVPALGELAVSLYLPGTVEGGTPHGSAQQTGYLSPPGDFSAAATLPVQRTIGYRPFLTGIDVEDNGAAIVALGDSITAGVRGSIDANGRWTDWLARRLQAERDPRLTARGRIGVVNHGIGGARLLDTVRQTQHAPDRRAERDIPNALANVDTTAGVRYLILALGLNDIGNSPAATPVAAQELIDAYRRVAAQARARGIAVLGATLPPFEGATYYSPAKEAVRQAVNTWIRAGGGFDGVIDFDLATRDPARPARLLPAYDSGDHLHPNDLGYQAMGDAVPLALFRAPADASAAPGMGRPTGSR